MLKIWLHLSRPEIGVSSCRTMEAAEALLCGASLRTALELAAGAKPFVLDERSLPAEKLAGCEVVPVPAATRQDGWRGTLHALAASGRCLPDDDVLLLAPFSGAVSTSMAQKFLALSNPNELSVAVTPVHCNTHPSWLFCLDEDARLYPDGSLLATRAPARLPLSRMFPEETASYLKADHEIPGSQHLPLLFECRGAMARCPGWLLAGGFIAREPIPVKLAAEDGVLARLHTLCAWRTRAWG